MRASDFRSPLATAFLSCLLLFASTPRAADASVAVRASIEDLTALADLAVEGVVLDHASTLDRAAGAIWTDWRVGVSRTLAGGAAPETIVVRVRGGRAGTIVQETLGAAKLTDGDRVVLFLGEEDRGARPVLGLSQGVFLVEMEAATGAQFCVNSTEGLSLVDGAGKGVEAGPIRVSLAELETRVAAETGRIAARRLAAQDRLAARLETWRLRAKRNAELTRGKPGGAPQ